ncbi:hypothetical protein IWQ62_003442, partial [Dispira parvispora]
YDTGRTVHEANVNAIATLLLDCGDKDGRHGYSRKGEAIIRNINPDIDPDAYGSSLRPDIAVFQGSILNSGERIHVFRDGDERRVLIVECKSDHMYNRSAENQLRAYMNFAEFPAGLLLSQRRASFFFQDMEDGWIHRGPEFSNISQHVLEIADIIREL